MAIFIEDLPDEHTREPFPQKWLRKQFMDPPVKEKRTTKMSDWLPLHWLLTEDEPRVLDIDCLLDQVGEEAFTAEVSPMSVAVARAEPESQILQRLIKFSPKCVATPDKDGAFALMYACAWNDSELALHSLYQLCPEVMDKVDKFGFHGLHYASYVGSSDVISYILQVRPEALKMRTVNGVLPLHAVAINNRHDSLKSVQMMLRAYPEVVYFILS